MYDQKKKKAAFAHAVCCLNFGQGSSLQALLSRNLSDFNLPPTSHKPKMSSLYLLILQQGSADSEGPGEEALVSVP